MLYTTNYNLNLVEGTDIVNPLVQQNPNYSTIDAAMFANKQASIGTGTELTAGTVHTITRANTDSNYVRFTATSNWTAGDTMVIDSTPCSVYLSDGSTPKTGAYVINTEVLILVSGSRVTLLASGKQNASQTDFNNSGTGLIATNVQDAIEELNNDEILATVTANGVDTLKEIMETLAANVDFTKLNQNSKLYVGGTVSYVYQITTIGVGTANFVKSDVGSGNGTIERFVIDTGSTSSCYRITLNTTGNTIADRSALVPGAGATYTVYR